mmetsp:Transcript_4138/g.6231  ORF Transcript_4138/g.6231 Transcript_4138/m.6231 type:complete len:123 (+) Transcript_4138:48-416(+)
MAKSVRSKKRRKHRTLQRKRLEHWHDQKLRQVTAHLDEQIASRAATTDGQPVSSLSEQAERIVAQNKKVVVEMVVDDEMNDASGELVSNIDKKSKKPKKRTSTRLSSKKKRQTKSKRNFTSK